MRPSVDRFRETESVETIALHMLQGNFGFAPIVDEERRPRGVITDRDLALRVCAANKKASRIRARDIMTRELVTCSTDEDIREAEERMADRQKSRILVLDKDGRLAGVISLSDIAARESELTAARTLRRVTAREAWM